VRECSLGGFFRRKDFMFDVVVLNGFCDVLIEHL
jgi:hypothetical protein